MNQPERCRGERDAVRNREGRDRDDEPAPVPDLEQQPEQDVLDTQDEIRLRDLQRTRRRCRPRAGVPTG